MSMWMPFKWLYKRGIDLVTLWPVLAAAGAVGVVTGWLSTGVLWISKFGAFGWWCAFLVGFLAASVGLLAVALVRERWAVASATKKWSRDTDTVNPLDLVFQWQRIKLADIAHPSRKNIKGKRFIDCELAGPANLLFIGGSHITGATFLDCQVVVLNYGSVQLRNVIVVDSCTIVGGEIYGCTLFLQPDLYSANPSAFPEPITAIPYADL